MNGLIYSRTPSGLDVAFNAADERSVAQALREFDDDLRLVWKVVDGQKVWEVVHHNGSDKAATWITDWTDEDGDPLPLSHGLVQRVKELHMESRAPQHDPLDLNDAIERAAREELDAEIDWYAEQLVKTYRGRTLHALHRGAYRRNTRFSR